MFLSKPGSFGLTVFSSAFSTIPLLKSLAKETISGHLIIDHIEFAPMPEYKNELNTPKRPLARITVLDVSKHIVFNPLTAWIRDNLIRKK